ncbi:hypothetical protein SARC_06877 [Sphaeroforma arctica JP610]|uniref:SNF2 N-terminal domain-containing protein n=1 Tax=Sphaeroforma arctica JP610 TaxID=667725 RepID=A0A0L0FXS7_9EUKA|nr:hypothetical protein SARC_06877 [Sphaeroforma arctica JP610]KNC80768.1 hypothetical protein SARC_06877 [Sphaeroforma arctica JP610]|eukprot:XP_014154670.1 hypothetical protein SARC_06877 [Sphaeroforma arctica JP610]
MVTDQKTSTSPVSETETPSSVKALKPLSSANTKSNIKPDADTVTKNTFIKGGVNMNTNTNEDVEKENMEGKPMVNNELDMDDSENEHLKCELTGVSKEWVQAEVAAEKEQVELFNHKKQERVNEVAAMTETSKNASLINLNSLVDKTLFYTKFLKKRMEERQKEQAEKEAAKAKRAEKKRAKQKEASARVESAEPCTKRVKRSKGTPVQTTLMGTKLSTAIENPTKATEGKRGGRRGRPKEVVPALTLDLDAVAQSKMSHANDGLGKTLQCIAFICYLLEMGVDGPFYVVTPLSTLQNWVNEFNRFAPTINAILYHGRPEDREEIREQVEVYRRRRGPPFKEPELPSDSGAEVLFLGQSVATDG